MNRMHWERFTDDPDYRLAIQYADENALVFYLKEGKHLEEIRERMVSLVKDEPAWDVFLCVSDTMAGEDRAYAAEIQKELSAKGLRVFYGREALTGIPKPEQEPYIFSALYTSRVMVLFASAAEQLSDVSVKNEWSRFLSLMEQDSRKYLIPAYAHMRPEFFPDELPAREAVDLTVSGSMMDLVHGVLRFAGKDNSDASYAEILRIRKNMEAELKKGNFQEVVRLGKEGTALAPDDADLWYLLFFGENQITSEQELSEKAINWMDSRSFTRAYELAARQRRTGLDKVKVNWQRYQERLLKDRRFAEDEKKAKVKTAQTASKARALMMKGLYQDAYKLLQDNVTATQEIVALRDAAALGCECGKIDTVNYLSDTLNRNHPMEMKKLRSFSATMGKNGILPWDAKICLIGLLMLTLVYLYGFILGSVESGILKIPVALCSLIGPVLVFLGCFSRTCGSMKKAFQRHKILPYFIAMFHLSQLEKMAEAEFGGLSEKVFYLILLLVALVFVMIALHDIPCQSGSAGRRSLEYYSKVIAPLEKSYIDAYKKKYEALVPYSPLPELTTVWDKYQSKRGSMI